MAPRWLDMETGNDSFRFKDSSTVAPRKSKETTQPFTQI